MKISREHKKDNRALEINLLNKNNLQVYLNHKCKEKEKTNLQEMMQKKMTKR